MKLPKHSCLSTIGHAPLDESYRIGIATRRDLCRSRPRRAGRHGPTRLRCDGQHGCAVV